MIVLKKEDIKHRKTDSQSFEDALNGPDAEEWKKAIQEEYDSIIKNKTYDLVVLRENHKAIGNKWVFKIKKN